MIRRAWRPRLVLGLLFGTQLFLVAILAAAWPRPASSFAGEPSRFTGKPELVILDVQKNGHGYYAERNTFSFTTDAGDVVTAFAGATTDLASIPRVFWPILPPDGPYAKAALIHDACYKSHGSFQFHGREGSARRLAYTRAGCDEILREGMVALRVPGWQRLTIYAAVRLFGAVGWGG